MTVAKAVFISAVSALFFLPGVAEAQSTGKFAKFSESSDELRLRMTYDLINDALDGIVMETGPSHRFFYRPRLQNTGSRISRVSVSPSWMEGNRIFFHSITDDQIQIWSNMRAGYEAIFDERAFSDLTKDQQLAYWLNLYNMGVIELVASQYPVKNIERLRDYWDMPVFMVAGVQMSLNDIHHNILLKNWDDPLVIYGLFQGAIGGPKIRRRAYTAETVWGILEENAEEFVNSIRGMRANGDDVMISEYYDWNRALFPDFENDVRAHIAEYANAETRELLAMEDRAEPKYFDWIVADLLQGELDQGSIYPNYLGYRFNFQQDLEQGGGGPLGGGVNVPSMISNTDTSTGSMDFEMPQIAEAFFRGIEMKFETHGYPQGVVTVEEVDNPDRVEAEGEGNP